MTRQATAPQGAPEGRAPEGRAPNMNDVARLAGVSLGTVSNALNKPEIVSEALKQRIQAAIDELGFVRNSAARSLAAGSADAVGLVLVDLENAFFVQIARGVEEGMQDDRKFVLLADSDVDGAKQSRYLTLFEEARVSGIILAPLDGPLDSADRVRDRGRPVVLVNYAQDGYCGVEVDEEYGGYLAARHLIGLGRTNLVFVGGPLTLRAIAGRLRGATRAVGEEGGPATLTVHETRTLSAREGREAADALAGAPGGFAFDGIIAAADTIAAAMVQSLTTGHGMRVPEDVAITGYDNNYFAADSPTPVTTVRQPGHEMGRAAAQLLLAEIQGEPDHEHRTLVLKPELIPRASTLGR